MDAFKISAKIFAAEDRFAGDRFVPIFHRWIQNQTIEGHLLIDVADYAHVVRGPGTVLVSSQANFHMDRDGGRLGLSYWRKTPLRGEFRQRLRAVILETFKAANLLQSEESLAGELVFRGDEIQIRLNDRLNAPATEETLAAVKGDFATVAEELFGPGYKLEPRIAANSLFEIRIKSPKPVTPAALLDRLATIAPSR
jgi:hypothetical protein